MVKKDAVVSLSYTLTNADGQQLDKSSPDKPFAYLHGSKQIVPGLENALEGMAIGDKRKSPYLQPKVMASLSRD